jgi:hypothetical protein
MLRDIPLKKSVLALMLTGVVASTASAQTISTAGDTPPPGQCTGGPFTLTAGEEVLFHIALHDAPLAPAMKVTLRIYDSDGTIVAKRTVTLAAGKTTTLGFRGAGLLRPQATFESLLNPNALRETVGSVELHGVDNFRAVIPVKCLPNENIGR